MNCTTTADTNFSLVDSDHRLLGVGVTAGATTCEVIDDGQGDPASQIAHIPLQAFTISPHAPKSICPPLPAHPDWGENFQQDIDMLNSQNYALRLTTFKQEVQTGGPWDYKDQVRGMRQSWADFGNFHYGFVGAGAHIPDGLLLWGAGWANWHDNPQTRPLYGSPFDPQNPSHGDQPGDQEQIKAGIAAYRAGCHY